ncbi:phytanoyl-CoA dioxygenase family protein [Massilia sp. IC2-278]|uniref:phytanoyl-CoA dioxygenase family protein n=1 Tax=Massilia sp. IC2-278 TaxID=2887200 RepID=UPI001E6102EF|nr:phytanoyl-CoA dioxygenase family protein [Massilia sp. IC2-278]MCC2959523.1 phytanoyl-CoA dioxygenase family protein [Massilia sp. IC2-278]
MQDAAHTPGHGTEGYDVATIMGGLYGDGIIACKGAFERAWVERLGQDIATLFAEARARPGGALERGPNRYYVEAHPERISGFADIIGHPWVVAVCRAVLGPDYRVVEAGFDIPGPGALHQPWHRDFASPEATLKGRRLNSLAFNITTVNVDEDMGPFEIAPGTQWDDLGDGDPMFPPRELWGRYEARAQRKLPRMGDISARSALTIHRGTANRSDRSRPVFVLGVDAPDARNADKHDLQLSRAYYESLAPHLREHITCRVVDGLENIVQAHTIEGLRMGLTM